MTIRENRRLFELTRHEATTDALTSLGNRRKLLNDLEHRFASAKIEPALLMIFDLDGFKAYNDTFGHPAGDALLARLGTKLAPFPEGTVPHIASAATSSASSRRSARMRPSS